MPDFIDYKTSNEENGVQLSKSELLAAKSTASDAEKNSSLAKLFDAAYENPLATGAALGAVAVGAAALCARGRIAEAWRKPGVLLIEDTPGLGMAFRDALLASGHKVTWVSNIKSLKPLTGVAADGAELNLARQKFNLALVDGDLGKGQLSGAQIVGTLKEHNIVSIGTSAVESFNKDMIANGASLAANKAVIYSSIFSRRFDLKTALSNPAQLQSKLDDFATKIRLPENAAMRKQADETLMSYLTRKN